MKEHRAVYDGSQWLQHLRTVTAALCEQAKNVCEAVRKELVKSNEGRGLMGRDFTLGDPPPEKAWINHPTPGTWLPATISPSSP